MLMVGKSGEGTGLRATKGKMACPGWWKADRVTQENVESGMSTEFIKNDCGGTRFIQHAAVANRRFPP